MKAKPVVLEDIDSPERISELRWMSAFNQWLEHDPKPLADALRDPSVPVPLDIRQFLADLLEGKAARAGGRPDERLGWVKRSIVAEVFREWDAFEQMPTDKRLGTPKQLACEQVASRRGLTADAVRGLVDELRKLKITRENWRKWGRPDWKDR